VSYGGQNNEKMSDHCIDDAYGNPTLEVGGVLIMGYVYMQTHIRFSYYSKQVSLVISMKYYLP
jgi:hypothetical protein